MRSYELKEKKRAEAKARQTLRNKRTNEQQLVVLTNRGHGHCAEATRLRNQVKKNKGG